jgi:hypothetical protein
MGAAVAAMGRSYDEAGNSRRAICARSAGDASAS